MRLHGGRYGYGIESSGGGGGFCMIAAEFGWNFMVLICCIGNGGVGFLVSLRGHGVRFGGMGFIVP